MGSECFRELEGDWLGRECGTFLLWGERGGGGGGKLRFLG